MGNFFKKLKAKINLLIYGPPCTSTSTSCCDAGHDDKDDKEQEKKPRQGGWVC